MHALPTSIPASDVIGLGSKPANQVPILGLHQVLGGGRIVAYGDSNCIDSAHLQKGMPLPHPPTPHPPTPHTHTYTAPTRTAPTYTAPTYTAPTYTAPTYTTPTHTAPT